MVLYDLTLSIILNSLHFHILVKGQRSQLRPLICLMEMAMSQRYISIKISALYQ